MRTTLNIPNALMEELMAESGETNKTLLIRLSLEEYLKKLQRGKLKALRGKMSLDIDLEKTRRADMLK